MLYHSPSRRLEIFLIDGKLDGTLTAKVSSWPGHILSTPRTRFLDAIKKVKKDKVSGPGVYILLNDGVDKPPAYIGQSNNVVNRIKIHLTNEDWWTRVIMITSIADDLYGTHVEYLESKLVQDARSSGKVKLNNKNKPSLPSLSDSDQAYMETFLDHVLMVMPAILVDAFVKKVRPATQSTAETKIGDSPIFECRLDMYNIHATARLVNRKFVVQAGSMARLEWGRERTSSYWKLHEKLIKQGILKKRDDHNIFVEDYAFSSTSAAGAVVRGTSARGPIVWKVEKTGQTYKDWEAAKRSKGQGKPMKIRRQPKGRRDRANL